MDDVDPTAVVAPSPNRHDRAQPRRRLRLQRPGGLLIAAVAVAPAFGQRWFVDTRIDSQLAYTTNGQLGTAVGQADTELNIHPQLAIHAEGARFRISGTAALQALTYARGTQGSRILPAADLESRLEAIDRFFFVEAGVRALQTSVNPFGAQPDVGATFNTLTTRQARLSPYVDATYDRNLHFRARSDNIATSENGPAFGLTATSGRSYFGHHFVNVERDPRPFGWKLELDRTSTRYVDSAQGPLTLDLARASVNYTIATDFSVGARAGRERNTFSLARPTRSIYGFQADWRPTERTQVSLFDEKRFFGNAWNLVFDHRSPQVAWKTSLVRDIDTTPEALFDLPATNNVAVLLDQIFTTRFPDPIDRAKKVQEFIATQGLPSSISRATTIVSQRLSVTESGTVTMALIGVRNSVALTVYRARTADAVEQGPFANGTSINNNVQYGGGLTLSRRLTPNSSASATIDYNRIRALQSIASDDTRQGGLRMQLNTRLAPQTQGYLGAHYRRLASNVAVSGREGTAFVGVDHRF